MKQNRIRIIGFFCVALGVCFSSCQKSILIEGRSSSEGSFWNENLAVQVKKSVPDETADVVIRTDQKQQQVEGFGGCFNELGWEELDNLSVDKREMILRDLFDQEAGCKFTICRMPIGANDYAVDWYSHNECIGDLEMKHFSIDRDKQRLVPYIKAAQKYAPNLKVWASPWCPPSWMKTNNHYACSPGVVNDLKPEGAGREMETQFRMEPAILDAYALYFSKFVRAYEKEGIPIVAVHVQNEPNSC